MKEFYQAIEKGIKMTGYEGTIDGEAIYNEICDEIEEKENGTYLLLSKKYDGTLFEYKIEIMDETLNLSYIHITCGANTYHAVFDQ